MPRDLILNVERRWFLPIKEGIKKIEFRAIKPYWTSRLHGSGRSKRMFDRVIIVMGYPKGYPYHCDPALTEIFPYRGYKIFEREYPKGYDAVAHTLNIDPSDNFIYGIPLVK